MKTADKKSKQYIYIGRRPTDIALVKIGITNDLQRRLKDYNSQTGISKENLFEYLFACEVKNSKQIENDIKAEFIHMREDPKAEMYVCTSSLLKIYTDFIKSHKSFVKELFAKEGDKKQIIKIVKKTTPSLKERGLSQKDIMQKAKKIDNDEFYTRYEDVEKELSMYDNSIWKSKTVFCNCDDAVDTDERRTSAFAIYFIRNFKKLELKKLICTHYSGVVDLFNQGSKGYIFTKTGYKEIKDYPEGYDGSFDHPLSLKILKEETDIVCTNPPFSRAIDYWDITIKSGKKFIIISNISNAINTAYIPYFRNKKVWAGYNAVDWFLTHKRELTRASGYWFTNIPIKNRPGYKNLKIVPLKDIPEKNKEYDDSKMLIVKNGYMPNDYKKPFAVSARHIVNGLLEKGYNIIQDKRYTPYTNGKEGFARVLVQKT